jgi:hypothetical protein
MTPQTSNYIVLDWLEKNPDGALEQVRWRGNRRIFTPLNYPKWLPCSNPDCEHGGYEIGDRIAALLASDRDSEHNSLICRNAIHPNRSRRCRHLICYVIACVRPFQHDVFDSRPSQSYFH